MRVYRSRPVQHQTRTPAPSSWQGDYDADVASTAGMVFEPDLPEAVWTGLLDHTGEPIYAYSARRPIGYALADDGEEDSVE